MPTTIDIESQRMFLGSTPVLRIYQGTTLLGMRITELFANGEQGVWYDPSDLSTLFQDAAGTTPVTAVEQPVGLMLDKSGRGNHAYQPTATSRPVLSARYNLLTYSEQFDDAVWGKSNATITPNAATAPDGTLTAERMAENTANTPHILFQNLNLINGTSYTFSFFVKPSGRDVIRAQMFSGTAIAAVDFNITSGTVISAGAGSGAITNVGNGWYRCSISGTASLTAVHAMRVYPLVGGTATYTGDGTSGIYIWGADLRVANDGANLPPYQRVNTATDYDTVGFPHYLRFDGVDDWLVTNTIAPGIDKVQVFAGVRKLSASVGAIVELSPDMNTYSGTSALFWDSAGWWRYSSKGTVRSNADIPAASGAVTGVLSGLGDISGKRVELRVNGTQGAQSTENQGTGNYLAYPLYIGHRGGTTLPFNGHLYGLIVRFGSNLPAATIKHTEKYINTKTRAY